MDYQEPEKEYSLAGIIDRFDGDNAVVIIKETQQIILWPIRKLAQDVNVGDLVWLHLACDKDLTMEREKIARKILEEVINGKEE
ncbi:DUF3006 family protein [bacterium]|nr:DUF3006 family protein [bacterium]